MTIDRSLLAANTLVVALASIVPFWVIGLEQFGPPAVLMFGLVVILVGGGRLKVPVTAWTLLALVLVTLLSLSKVSGFRALALFARGHVILVTGLVALVLAANAGTTRRGLERVVRGFILFTLLVVAMAVVFALGWMPDYFEVPFKGIFGDAFQASAYFRGNILLRKMAVRENLIGGGTMLRMSAVFLYATLLGAVMLPLLTLGLSGLQILSKRWRVWCWLAAAGAIGCILATNSRSAIIFAGTILVAAAAWRFVGRRRGPALLVTATVMVVTAAVVALWLPVDDTVMWKKVVLEQRAYSAEGRVDIYFRSLRQLMERPLLGMGTQEIASQKGWTFLRLGTHSELLNMAYRFGLVGLFGYLAVGATFAVWYLHRLGHLLEVPGESRRIDLMVLMGIGVGVLALNALMHMIHWDVNVYWISLGLVGLIHAVGSGTGPLANPVVAMTEVE